MFIKMKHYDSKIQVTSIVVTMMNQKRSNNESSLSCNISTDALCGWMPLGFKPHDMDIVCGRGWANAHREGNQAFTEVIQANLHLYLKASSRIEKSTVVSEVLDRVLCSGARFLKEDKVSQRWRYLTREEAHSKVGHSIRDMIRQHRKDVATLPEKIKRPTERFQRAFSLDTKKCYQAKSHRRSKSLADLLTPKTLFENDKDVDATRPSLFSSECFFVDEFKNLGNMYDADLPCKGSHPTNASNTSGNLRNIFDETPLPAQTSCDAPPDE
jgi:hypothetical protein